MAADALCNRLALAVLALVAVMAALTFRDYGLGWDDYTHSEYGDLLVAFYASGFADKRALSFVNLYAYGGGFDLFAALVAKVLRFDLFETRRLCGAFVGMIGLVATWRTGRHLAGPLGGLAALILLAACPLYYGHMFMNPKDAPLAVAMAIALLGIVRALGEYPAPRAGTLAILGLGFGLSIGTRILGGFSAIYALAGLALIVWIDARVTGIRPALAQAGRFVVRLTPAIVLAYAVMALVWPWSVVNPLNPILALEYFSHFFEKPWKELFAGELLPVTEMPHRYVPQLFALKLPELMLATGIAGAVAAALRIAGRRQSPARRAMLLAVLLAAALPIAIAVVTRPAAYNGIRHFLFVTPPIAVLAGWMCAEIVAWARERSRIALPAFAVVFLAALAPAIVDMVRLHPYQYTHFNHIAGGVRGAHGRYMIDYWGLSFKQASQALRAWVAARGERPPDGGRWQLAVCGPHRPPQVELGPGYEISWEAQGASFAMMLGEFYCRTFDAPLIAEIKREGVVYARVYDIRGKSIDNLLTIPEP